VTIIELDALSLSCIQARFLHGYIVSTHKTNIVIIFNSAALLCQPMVAQCRTAAVLFGLGDLIVQQMFEKKGLKGHDVHALFLPLSYHPLGYFLGIMLINS